MRKIHPGSAAIAILMGPIFLTIGHQMPGHAGIEITRIDAHLDTSRLHRMDRDLHPLNESRTSVQQPPDLLERCILLAQWADTAVSMQRSGYPVVE